MLSRGDLIKNKACEECSRAKVRCSSDDPSCKRCVQRSLPCFYPIKRRKGFGAASQQGSVKSQGSSSTSSSSSLTKTGVAGAAAHSDESNSNNSVIQNLPSLDLSTLSQFERRCWAVFFSLFRSQQRNRIQNPVSYCWFATQVKRLYSFFERRQRIDLVDKLKLWLKASNVDVDNLSCTFKFTCWIPPNNCVGCAMRAVNLSSGCDVHLKENVFDLEQQDFISLNSSSSTATSTSNSNVQPKNYNSLMIKNVIGEVENMTEPYIHLFTRENGDTYDVEINDAFIHELGYTKEELVQALSWTGSSDGLAGFLPWYGDFFACILHRELDLLSFLQILAIKYQTAGPIAYEDSDQTNPKIRELPASQLYDVRTNYIDANSENNGKENKNEVIQCLISVVYRERLQNGIMHLDMFAKILPLHQKEKSTKEKIKATSNGSSSSPELPLSSSHNFQTVISGNVVAPTSLSDQSVGSQSDTTSTGSTDSPILSGLVIEALPDDVNQFLLPSLFADEFSNPSKRDESVITAKVDQSAADEIDKIKNDEEGYDVDFIDSLLEWAGPFDVPDYSNENNNSKPI